MLSCNSGDFICWDGYEKVKVMTYQDGYYMLRRPRCAPFLKSKHDLEKLGAKLWSKTDDR